MTILQWFLKMFGRPNAIPAPVNRKDKRTRQSIARRQAAKHKENNDGIHDRWTDV